MTYQERIKARRNRFGSLTRHISIQKKSEGETIYICSIKLIYSLEKKYSYFPLNLTSPLSFFLSW